MYYRPYPDPGRSRVFFTRPPDPPPEDNHPTTSFCPRYGQSRWSLHYQLPSLCFNPHSSHYCGKQSIDPPPETVGISFATDVIKRAQQFILVLRESVTSYTVSTILPDERYDTLRDALISLCINRKAPDNIDLNQMSHRYVSGVLQNEPLTSAHLINRCENVKKGSIFDINSLYY